MMGRTNRKQTMRTTDKESEDADAPEDAARSLREDLVLATPNSISTDSTGWENETDNGDGEDDFQFKEIELDGLDALNEVEFEGRFTSLLVNVRSLDKNFSHLQVFLENLKFKPHLVVCTETWNLDFCQYYTIKGYKIFYNNSYRNAADGVVMYVREDLPIEESKIVTVCNVNFLSITVALRDKLNFTCTGLYRCHDVSEEHFSDAVKVFLRKSSKIKNHHIYGDFNINLLNNSLQSSNFLFNFMEREFLPLFSSITRPNMNDNRLADGSCIDNIFVRNENSTIQNIDSYKIKCPFLDHYPLFSAFDYPQRIL